jgi:4-carboxymuconolactone decarboxylase
MQVLNSSKEGLEQSIIDAINKGQEPALTSPKDLAAFQLCKELVETRQVSDKTYQQAMELFGENGVDDIVVTTGFFTMCRSP